MTENQLKFIDWIKNQIKEKEFCSPTASDAGPFSLTANQIDSVHIFLQRSGIKNLGTDNFPKYVIDTSHELNESVLKTNSSVVATNSSVIKTNEAVIEQAKKSNRLAWIVALITALNLAFFIAEYFKTPEISKKDLQELVRELKNSPKAK